MMNRVITLDAPFLCEFRKYTTCQKCCCIQIEKFCAKNQRTKNSQKNHSRKCRGNVPRSQFKIILAFSRAFHATVVIKVVSHRSFESLPVRLLLNPRAPRESSAVFLQHPRDQTVLPNAVEWSSTASANNRQIRNKAGFVEEERNCTYLFRVLIGSLCCSRVMIGQRDYFRRVFLTTSSGKPLYWRWKLEEWLVSELTSERGPLSLSTIDGDSLLIVPETLSNISLTTSIWPYWAATWRADRPV